MPTPNPVESDFAGSGALDTAINLAMGVKVVTTTLAANLSNVEIDQVFLVDATGIPFRSTIVIDDEIIFCDGRFGDTLQALERGVEGTTPASHTAGATVTYYSPPRIGNTAIADALIAVESSLLSNTFGFVKGTGTAHRVPVWTAADTIGDSGFFDDGSRYLRAGDFAVQVGIEIDSLASLIRIGDGGGIANNTLFQVDDFSRQISLVAGDLISISSAWQVAIGDNTSAANGTTFVVDDSSELYFFNKLGVDGFVKTGHGDGRLVIDTNVYLTGNQTVTLSGDVSGSGATAITVAIGAGKVTFAMLATAAWDGDVTLAADSSTKLPTQHAVKSYVDNLITGLRFKQDCRVASTANVNVSSPGASIDGVTLSNGDRVLLKNQSTASQNGAYVFNGSASAMTRATDADAGSELVSATFPIREGAANADTWWTCTNDSVTIGITSIAFTQTAGAGTYTNGSGLSLSGNSFSISSGGVTNTMLAGGIDLTAKVTGILPVANGGTGVAYFTVAGPTATRTYTFPDANATIARTDAANTFTGHQTVEGVTSTGATGTGKFVFDASPTITTPKIITAIKDTNGNTIFGVNATASAVDYLEVVNGATASPATVGFNALGTDSNIQTVLTNKGTGRFITINTQDAVTNSGLAIRNTGTSVATGAGFLFQFGSGTNIGGVAAVTTDVTGGTEKADLFFRVVISGTLTEVARLTSANNFKLAGTATRGTTEGTNHIDIFNGTAPVGTLTNGISLYSTAGELRVMDAAGNATLLSPHDEEGNWIHDEVNFKGRRLRVDMEKLMKFLNGHFGLEFVSEVEVD